MSGFRHLPAFAALAVTLLCAPVAQSSVEPAVLQSAPIKGWTAVAGLTGPAVLELARTLPLSAEASSDQPWCDSAAAVAHSLRSEFDEQPVTHRADGTQLWGSDLMGTWTLVLGRNDGTQCVIASGIGYQDGTNPLAFYAKVDLG
ncbi:hypothetical protein [Paracoccus contaminans]|uniref:Alkaline proteinase inhibitor/ Outer membrane lipoprotein Omp19 domain-containing protein n=1 Tax=Paracoccus contaminans TaxID=1945662 RepID=A0A1W6CW34_9RHOB|nr:hypothetical protein [Paracoccus contaminans]ARJ69082.1 hypothetical protein B0A89_05025 [Paracoccus contaminans]